MHGQGKYLTVSFCTSAQHGTVGMKIGTVRKLSLRVALSPTLSNATVSTKPTPAGEDVLDPFHPLGITKHLVDKAVRTRNTDIAPD